METRIQPLHDGTFIIEKVCGMHVQRMLEMIRCLYTGGNLKQKLGKKIDQNLMVLFQIIILQVNNLVPVSLSANMYFAFTTRTTDVFAYGKY